jgi:hypothetical protein
MVMRLTPGASKSRWPTSTTTYHTENHFMTSCTDAEAEPVDSGDRPASNSKRREHTTSLIPLIAQRSSAPSMEPVHEAPSSSLGDHLPGRLLVDRKACHHFTRSVQFSVYIDHPPFLSMEHICIPCHSFIFFHNSCLPLSRKRRERRSVIRMCRPTP